MSSKLTLSVDPVVAERAKEYAADHGTSVSQLVTKLLDAVTRPDPGGKADDVPILRRLRGSFKRQASDDADFHAHLVEKYR